MSGILLTNKNNRCLAINDLELCPDDYGSTGPTGQQGMAGTQGTQGTPGVTGPTGPPGFTGQQGIAGTQGTQGTPGVTGPTGTVLQNGLTYSNYLFWEPSSSSYIPETGSRVHIGSLSGSTNQGTGAIAIGNNAGSINQGTGAIAIGNNAGLTGQGANAIAIGNLAVAPNQHTGSISVNASGTSISASNPGFYVNPVRGVTGTGILYPMCYNRPTSEIYDNSGDLFVGGNLIVNGGFLTVGSNQISNQSISSLSTSATFINLTATDIRKGLIAVSCTGTGSILSVSMPSASSFISGSSYSVGTVLSASIFTNGKNIDFDITQGTGVTFFGSKTVSYGSGIGRHLKILITNNTSGSEAYTVYS